MFLEVKHYKCKKCFWLQKCVQVKVLCKAQYKIKPIVLYKFGLHQLCNQFLYQLCILTNEQSAKHLFAGLNMHCKTLFCLNQVNNSNYPIVTNAVSRIEEVAQTRAVSSGQLIEERVTNLSERSFIHDAMHIWNKAPSNIKECKSYSSAKKAIKMYVLTLPIQVYTAKSSWSGLYQRICGDKHDDSMNLTLCDFHFHYVSIFHIKVLIYLRNLSNKLIIIIIIIIIIAASLYDPPRVG